MNISRRINLTGLTLLEQLSETALGSSNDHITDAEVLVGGVSGWSQWVETACVE